MNVLSLFDGISCGQVALERAGIKVDNYYASEIDKYAIQVTQKNYPNTKQLGDVRNIKIPSDIDLLLAGSPCTGFSVAGKGKNFDDPQSKLFWCFVDILEKTKPRYFLLENVSMRKEWEQVISNAVGCNPVFINSNLFSAQDRKRLYWTNIPIEKLPSKNELVVSDILETKGDWRQYPINENFVFTKGRKAGYFKTNSQGNRVYNTDYKSVTLCGSAGGMGGKTGLYLINEVPRDLSPIECERLQTLPCGYTEGISRAQRHKTIGNGWTVDVIVHILKQLNKNL